MKFEPINPRKPLTDIVPLAAPMSIYIDPCGACNFSCKFCPCNRSDFNAAERHKIMPFELFEKIVSDIKQMGRVHTINLACFGEPLLNRRYCDMVRLLRENDLCDEIKASTNGWLLNPELNDDLACCGLSSIRLSVEGLSNEDYQNSCGVEIDFEKLVEKWGDLYAKTRHGGSGTSLIAKLIATNVHTEEDARKFEEIFGGISDYYFIEPQEGNCWPLYKTENILSDEIDASYVRHFYENQVGGICSWPLISMVINSNGDVQICCSDWKRNTFLGNIIDTPLNDIWNGERINEFRRKLLLGDRQSACASCAVCQMRNRDVLSQGDVRILLSRISF